MSKKEDNWFAGITPPSSTLSDGLGYLDRLIDGGSQKQYLKPAQKRNNNNPKSNNNNKQAVNLFAKVATKVDIDDVKWIEERKKKFPKLKGSSATLESCQNSQTLATDSSSQYQLPSASSSTSIRDIPKPPSRKKTLFEKLLDQNQ